MSTITSKFRVYATGSISILLLACSLFVFSPSATAAEGDGVESITLSPVSTRFEIEAGTVREEELTILNDGTTAYDFIVYARPYSVKNDTYEPDFEPDMAQKTNADAYQWVQFAQTTWRIEAGETKKVPYTIRVPKNVTPGGHYGVIFAETQPKEAPTGTSVARKKRVGSLVYATVKGTYTTGGQSLGATISPIQFRAPLVADLTVENTGNADFEIETTYRISDLFGKAKYQEQKKYIVLPSTARKLDFSWSDAPWFGLFNVTIETKFLDKTTSDQGLVLLVPRWLLLVLGIAAVGGGVYVALRKYRR